MIITKTATRISLAGGGSDHPEWYREHGGQVVGFAIDKYVYVSVRNLPPYFAHKYRVAWSQIECVKHYNEIQLPPVREALRFVKPFGGLEIHYDADLPARSGMGSSSSFMVGLLNALRVYGGHHPSPRSLAVQATYLEREVLGDRVGDQDQVWAAYGGVRRISFGGDAGFATVQLMLGPTLKALERRLHLFYTGVTRSAAEAAAQIGSFAGRAATMHQLAAGATAMLAALLAGDLDTVGDILHEGWQLKRELASGVSSAAIDAMYARAREAGARGGKLLGAGGGGFLLLDVPEGRIEPVRAALDDRLEVPFRIGAEGSQVIFCSENGE